MPPQKCHAPVGRISSCFGLTSSLPTPQDSPVEEEDRTGPTTLADADIVTPGPRADEGETHG